MLLGCEHCPSIVFCFIFFLVCVDWWVVACHGSLWLLSKITFFFLVFISLALMPTYYLYLLTSLSVDHFSCEKIWLSLFLLCFLLLILGPLFSYFTNSNCIEMRRLDIFSQGLEDIFKGSFSFSCHSYLNILLIYIQIPHLFLSQVP